jgi:hypothetical protein
MAVKLHPRTFIVQDARTELQGFMLELERKHELSINEVTMLVSEFMANFTTSCVRQERQENEL